MTFCGLKHEAKDISDNLIISFSLSVKILADFDGARQKECAALVLALPDILKYSVSL